MTYVPKDVQRIRAAEVYVSAFSRSGIDALLGGSAPASGAWPAANSAFYYPIVLPSQYTVARLWWLNGSTVGTNNLQAGIYRPDYTSVVLGTATLSAGASGLQYDDITDTVLPPGRYYLALWCSGTTATVFRTASLVHRHGFLYQASLTSGLPSTMTPTTVATNFYPVFGITSRATP